MSNKQSPARRYALGIGEAVANRTINRDIFKPYKYKRTVTVALERSDHQTLDDKVEAWATEYGYLIDGYEVVGETDDDLALCAIKTTGRKTKETWADVANRVAIGNTMLDMVGMMDEFPILKDHIRRATLLTSGRHLQHGDATQPDRNLEIFSNCSTSAASFISFYLLLNGSGVGRSYDDAAMVVDWNRMPIVVPVLDHSHADVQSGEISALAPHEAKHTYKFAKQEVFEVPDTREGWAQAVEKLETMAWQERHDEVLILDFSKVRPRGAPIQGMQGRPASGPGPLMEAFNKIKHIRGSGMRPWRATMFVDHYLSECVLVGGARRAARMSTKSWRDKGVLEFIEIKRGGFLWSSNNSVTVDNEFWEALHQPGLIGNHAKRVFETASKAAYFDKTGEPGFINQDMLVDKGDKSMYADGVVLTGGNLEASVESRAMFRQIMENVQKLPYHMITNPCGEIALLMWGGYCVLADVVPYHAKDADDAEEAFRAATRFLIRANKMDSLYKREVSRTNRIGVSMTGIHEYAMSMGYTWHDLLDEKKSQPFWDNLARFKRAVDDEAVSYSMKLGMNVPHTTTTIKPAGTTSKLFGLSEGAHLPAMREYLRWVQFRSDDPLLKKYEDMGYPIRKLKTYGGTTVVGFPTQPEICRLTKPENIVTATEATPEEQYEWIRLLEKYWIRGVCKAGLPLEEDTGNQISYTLKIDVRRVSYDDYLKTLKEQQSSVKCCTIMPFDPDTMQVYEYLPEESVTKEQYELMVEAINVPEEDDVAEDVDMETLQCASGACPL